MQQKRLKKHLGLYDVFSFGIGPMLSSGIFLLPGMVYHKVGPAAILAYLIAGLLIIPSLLSKAELATAMPRAGGAYYFLDRSMGPLVGTISGLGTWLSLTFKSAFDLIGLGAYLVLFLDFPMKPVAVGLCFVFAGLSISGVKKVSRFQGIFVSLLLGIMAYFIAKGFLNVQPAHFKPFFAEGDTYNSIIGSIGFVYVSFAGLTKIASVAEEVENLERNIPLGMILALVVTLIIYILGMIVIIGVLPGEQLGQSLTPVVDAAMQYMGPIGKNLMAVAAVLAFVASANAGMTAASRYPLAMSRDNLIPKSLQAIGRFHTPTRSILLTMGLMIFFILALSPEGIAKVASAFKLLIFGMLNLAVIVMRESKIAAYDPGFKTKLYPWVQIIGIITPIILIPELGLLPMILSAGVIVIGTVWYYMYAEKKVDRSAAMYQVFERVGSAATPQLDHELRQILREKGLRREDAFEQSILRASILYHHQGEDLESILRRASKVLAARMDVEEEKIYHLLAQTQQRGETPIGQHVALPHARMEDALKHELVIVHSREGVLFEGSDERVYVLFILISPIEDQRQHLRFLAELANRAENIDFAGNWRKLYDNESIRACFLRSGDVGELEVNEKLAGRAIRDLGMQDDCLVALVKRGEQMIIPRGRTILQEGDQLTLIGRAEAIDKTLSHLHSAGE